LLASIPRLRPKKGLTRGRVLEYNISELSTFSYQLKILS
jgi:hypothetical protein